MNFRLPQVNARQIISVLLKNGFEETNQKGSHLFFYNKDKRVTTSVPMHPGDVKRALLKKIIRQAGLSEDEFRSLL